MKLTRENAILPFPTSSGQATSLHGLIVGLSSGVLTAVDASPAFNPLGACVHYDAAGSPASVAMMSGGLAGTVKVTLDGAVSEGDYLVLADGGLVVTDPGTGARTQIGQAIEAGVAGEMVEAILFHPITLA